MAAGCLLAAGCATQDQFRHTEVRYLLSTHYAALSTGTFLPAP